MSDKDGDWLKPNQYYDDERLISVNIKIMENMSLAIKTQNYIQSRQVSSLC